MNPITAYLSTLPVSERAVFATSCGTSLGYLRKAISVGQRLGESLCINLERESKGAITCEALRPDVDWAYLRGTNTGQKQPSSLDTQVMCAISGEVV